MRESVHLGATLPDAMDFVLSWYGSEEDLAAIAPRSAEQSRRDLASTLSRHIRADGRISLPSTAWLVRARTKTS